MRAESTTRSPVSPAFTISSNWIKVMTLLVLSWVALLGFYSSTAQSLVDTWSTSDTYGHGFLIFPVSGYLVWRQRRYLAVLVPCVNLWALLLLGGLATIWLLGHLTSVLVVQQLAVIAMVGGLVWTLVGTAATKVLLFPLAYLFFAVPVGADLVPLFQDFTASFTVAALQVSGVPVLWEGRYLTTPSGSWHVAEACSGVRYLIASVSLGVWFAGIVYRSWTRRVLFVLASILVPILANGLRAYGIVLFGYLVDHQLAAGVDHILYGGLFFSVIMFLLFVVGLALREPGASQWREVTQFSDGGVSRSISGDRVGQRTHGSSFRRMAMTAGCGVGVVALAPLWVSALPNSSQNSLENPPLTMTISSPWKALPDYAGNWIPHYAGADSVVTRTYQDGKQQVHLVLALYVSQHQGKELISQTNTLVDKKRWRLLMEGWHETRVDGQSLTVRENRLRSPEANRLIWSWYWVDGRFTSNAYLAKLLYAKEKLLGRPGHSALLAVGTDYEFEKTDAIKTLEDFLQHTALLTTLNSFYDR